MKTRHTDDGRSAADPRRRALLLLGLCGGGLLVAGRAGAQEALAETDPTAQALGYKADAAQVDAAKFPKHAANQTCASCNFFKAEGAGGSCQLFPGKRVSSKGWCSAYAAKA